MPTGLVRTYDLTVGVMLDFEDFIHQLSPTDIPLQGGMGAEGRTALATGTCFEKKIEWQDEELLVPRTTLGAAKATADTFITIKTGERERFSTGDVILIDSEYMRVTGYGSTAETLTVSTGFNSSTATNHANLADVVGVGTVLAEGSDPENARVRDRVARHNFTQIFGPTKVEVSASENVVRKYGLSGGEFQKQTANRLKELAVSVEQALIYGKRLEDTTNKWRSMGGLDFYIDVHVDSTTTDITEAKFLDQCQNIWDAGGNIDRALMGAAQKRKVSAFNSSVIRYGQAETTRGQIVDALDTDFGRLTMILHRWVKKNNIFLFSRDQAEIRSLRPLVFEMLAKTGDSMKGQVVCEKTFQFVRQSHAAKFTALT